MINSVSATSSVSQIYLQQQQQDVTHKTKALPKPGKQDSVVLSKEAQAAARAARQGERR
jgi:hypothetical protein